VQRSRTISVAVFVLLAAVTGCQTAKQVVRPVIALALPGDEQDRIFTHVARAVGRVPPHEWDFETPHRLRPCCAFGSGLTVRVGYLPIAGLRLDNVVEADELGHHKYNSGLVSLKNEPSNAFISPEKNGLVYTCRGGFIDTAHVRDYADWMAYLVVRIRDLMDEGGTIVLPNEGGYRYVHVGAIKSSFVDRVGPQELAIHLAQWTAIHLAIWHETATWYGWSSWGAFPETASAFSPEDLYSNLVGILLASELIRAGLASYEAQYDAAMDVAMPEVLRRLGAAPAAVTHAAIHAVDGRWWDSHRPLPDKEVLLRRNFDIGPHIRPWQPPLPPGEDERIVRDFCDGDRGLLSLRYPTTIRGEPLHYMVRLEVYPDAKLYPHLGIYKPDGIWVSQEEFPAIVRRAQLENRNEFGDDGDRP
jgi:Protein of unknown function (DUF4056)